MTYNIQDDITEIINRLRKDNISFQDKTILVTGGSRIPRFLGMRCYCKTRGILHMFR